MLFRLVRELSCSKENQYSVISLTTLDDIGIELQSCGVRVYALGLNGIFDLPFRFFDLVRLIKKLKPNIVQTWMYHADFIGGSAAYFAKVDVVIWGIRSTSIPQGIFSLTFWLVRLCSFFSWIIPTKIICCALSAKKAHIKLGYSPRLIEVIPNGFEFESLSKNQELTNSMRFKLGFTNTQLVIGVLGRFDPLKDYLNFVTAASIVSSKLSNAKFLMVGRGNDFENATLQDWLIRFNLLDKFTLMGEQANVQSFLSAMDIFCLSSVSEAFPNVVAEAMAMGLPCVVTNAGDAAAIIGDDHYVVPTKDSLALACKLLEVAALSSDERRSIGQRNAEYVRLKFDMRSIALRYERTYKQALVRWEKYHWE